MKQICLSLLDVAASLRRALLVDALGQKPSYLDEPPYRVKVGFFEAVKDVSTMFVIVFALRKGGLKRHFSAEREILKLMFAFDHINCAGYITYQHVYLNNLLRKDNGNAKDLVNNGHTVN